HQLSKIYTLSLHDALPIYHVVRNWIDAKLSLIKVLHHIRIAKLGEISDAVYVTGKVRPVFQAKPVSTGRNILSDLGRLVYVRVLDRKSTRLNSSHLGISYA